MTTPYEDGRRFAYRASMAFARDGYEIIRSAGSKTKADFVAVKPGQLLFVQVKKAVDGTIPPEERKLLCQLAGLLPGVAEAIVVHKRIPRGFAFRRLTGPGPKDWQPWTPDEVAP